MRHIRTGATGGRRFSGISGIFGLGRSRTWAMIAAVLLAAVLPSGCLNLGDDQPAVTTGRQPLAPPANYLPAATVQADVEGQGETAVENALIWSEKYAESVEKLAETQQANHEFQEANRELAEQVVTLQQELNRCKQELDEGNAMLIEMRGELSKWKANVLGFRQEMRQAQETQLIALRKVLILLGGELNESQAAATEPTAPGSSVAKDEGST